MKRLTLSVFLLVGGLAHAADIGVLATKLVVVDKLAAAGKAKTVFVSKDTGVVKGAGLDPELVSVELYLQYDDGSAAGAFVVPPGTANGWVVNKETVAKYVNKDAPMGVTQAKVAVIKPAKLLKLVAKGLGDTPFDILSAGAPSLETVETAYCVTNDGERNCHCSIFTGCAYKSIAAGTGAKLVCKNGDPDALCMGIEHIPPDTLITAAPGDPTNEIGATFAFESPDPWAIFECQLDGGGFTSCESDVVYPALLDGVHTFEVRAIDLAGNVDATPATHTWTIDTVPPTTFLTATPPDPSNDATPTFEFFAEPGSTFECRVDGGAYAPCPSPTTLAPLADGIHTFEVRAVDPAGNVGPTGVYAWTVDIVPPETFLNATPSDPSNDVTPTFEFTSEVGSTFQCRVDAGAYSPCGSPTTLPPLAGGFHTFEVRAVDLAGNADPTPATYTWTIDTVPPVVVITGAPVNPTNQSSATFTFMGGEPGVEFECQLDGGPVTPCASGVGYPALLDGVHAFAVRGADPAGNLSAPASYTWVVDTVPPAVTINRAPTQADPTNTQSVVFTVAFSEPVLGFTTADVSVIGTGLSVVGVVLSGGGASYTVTVSVSGSGTVTAQIPAAGVVDAAGNLNVASTSTDNTVVVDMILPETTITSGPATPTASTIATFTFTSNEPATFQCRIDGGSFGACSSGVGYGGLDGRTHSFEVRAIDLAGNVDPTPAVYGWTVSPARLPYALPYYYGNAAGGTAYNDACPVGQALIGFNGRTNGWFNQLQAVCGTLSYSGGASGGTVFVGAGSTLPLRGNLFVGTAVSAFCPANRVVVGFRGRAGSLIDQLIIRCAALTATPVPGGYNYAVTSLTDVVVGGGAGGTAFPQNECPTGTIATVARIRAGDSIDGFGMTCTF